MSAWFRRTPAIAEELDVATTTSGQDHRDFVATEGAAAGTVTPGGQIAKVGAHEFNDSC